MHQKVKALLIAALAAAAIAVVPASASASIIYIGGGTTTPAPMGTQIVGSNSTNIGFYNKSLSTTTPVWICSVGSMNGTVNDNGIGPWNTSIIALTNAAMSGTAGGTCSSPLGFGNPTASFVVQQGTLGACLFNLIWFTIDQCGNNPQNESPLQAVTLTLSFPSVGKSCTYAGNQALNGGPTMPMTLSWAAPSQNNNAFTRTSGTYGNCIGGFYLGGSYVMRTAAGQDIHT